MSAVVRWHKLILTSWIVKTRLIGLTSLKYNAKTNRMERTWGTIIYGAVIHLSFFVSYPFYVLYAIDTAEKFFKEPYCVNAQICTIVMALVTTCDMLMRYSKQNLMKTLCNHYFALDEKYFPDELPNYSKAFYVNFFLIMGIYVHQYLDMFRCVIVMLAYKQTVDATFLYFFNFFYEWSVLNGALVGYSVMMLRIAEYHSLIRQRVARLALHSKACHKYLRLHQKLQHLTQETQDVYSFHIALWFTIFTPYNTKVFFTTYRLIFEEQARQPFLTLLAVGLFVSKLVYAVFINFVCERLKWAQNDIYEVLSPCTLKSMTSARKCQRCEMFLLMRDSIVKKHAIGGLFDLNRAFAFTVLSTSFLYAIVIVQLDMSLKNATRAT